MEDEIKLIFGEEIQSHSLLSQFDPKDTQTKIQGRMKKIHKQAEVTCILGLKGAKVSEAAALPP